MAGAQIDLVAVLREVVEPCLTAFVRSGMLKRGDVEGLALRWQRAERGLHEVEALVLTVTVESEVFTFRLTTADDVDSFDPRAAADGLEERLEVFIADVMGRPTPRDFM